MADTNITDDPALPIDRKVAIVGIGCRFPGDINNVDDFWKTVAEGRDCMIPHPPERLDPSYLYPGVTLPGKIYTRRAGYLSQDVHAFDREFFHISPDEASFMDPQIRILLEVVWETLEDYGVNVDSLVRSQTGVYVGVMTKEYALQLVLPDHNANQYGATGNNSNMVSNRVSYQFDFQGPSITVDTACSSSMYAIHYACEAIRNGECDLALAGGVNLLQAPSTTIQLCQARMVCHDGRCKSFDNQADGYARGEGVGMLLLKPLQKAIDDGDKIYAVIRGGALNNDGKTKGITSPNIESQARLLKSAYEAAQLLPQEIPYIEAHGTGTQAGDVAEATSVGTVLGLGRTENHPPLIIGSVKSNFGHTEGAAGVASVIKASLVLQKKKIPKVVHLKRKNKNVDWKKFNMTPAAELMDWPEYSKHVAGCNGFGFGGANAHIVLEASPSRLVNENPQPGCLPSILFLSAASKEALDQRTSDWLTFLRSQNYDPQTFQDIILTAALRTTHHQYRLALYSESMTKTIGLLEKRLECSSEIAHMFVEGRAQASNNGQAQKLAFVFSGMGTQWWGMGRRLMQTDEVFQKTISEIDHMLKDFGAKWSLKQLLTEETDQDRIHDTEIAQPAICATQIALVAVYRSLGIHPQVVIGHSVGEVAAACAGGYLSVRDAMKLIYVRGKSLQKTSGQGKMAAILTSVEQVREKIASSGLGNRIDIACINSPSQTVISGDAEAVEQFVQLTESQGVRSVLLKVNNAYHSFQQNQIEGYFRKHTKFLHCPKFFLGTKNTPTQIPMISTVNGEVLSIQTLNSNAYWWQNIRQTVKFADSMKVVFERGCNVCMEIGPHPSLLPAIKGTMSKFSERVVTFFHEDYSVISSLRRPSDTTSLPEDKVNILMSVAKLHVQGYPINHKMLFPDAKFNVISLPRYPWQRKLYSGVSNKAEKLFVRPRTTHPLLGKPVDSPQLMQNSKSEKVWKSSYSQTEVPWLSHHKIQDAVVLPGTAYIDIMLVATSAVCRPATNSYIELENVQFKKFHYSPQSAGTLYTILNHTENENGSPQKGLAIRTYDDAQRIFAINATCEIKETTCNTLGVSEPLNIGAIKERCTVQVTPKTIYGKLAQGGIQIGKLFAAISEAWYSATADEALIFAKIPKSLINESNMYYIHPTLLDAMFQLHGGFSAVHKHGAKPYVEVPKSIGTLRFACRAPPEIAIHARKSITNDGSLMITIANKSGSIIAEVNDVRFSSVGSDGDSSPCLWYEEWDKLESAPTLQSENNETGVEASRPDTNRFHLIPDDLGVAETLSQFMDSSSVHYEVSPIVEGSLSDREITSEEQNVFRHVVCLTFLNECTNSALDEISKSEVIESQTSTILRMIKETIAPWKLQEKEKSAIWVVTKGGMMTPCDKSVNPFMAKAHALLLTFMNEYPELFVAAVDLPNDLALPDCATLLFQFLQNPNMTENCLALRVKNTSSQSQKLGFEAFALRLTYKKTSQLKLTNTTTNWMIDLQNFARAKSEWYLKRLDIQPQIEPGYCIVNLKSFTQLPFKHVQTSGTQMGFIFAGRVMKSSSEKHTNNCAVLGYSQSQVVASTLKCKSCDLAVLPRNVGITDAIVVVKSCLQLYLAVQKIPTPTKDHYLAVTSNDPQIHIDFLSKYAQLTGVQVMLLIKSGCSVDDHKNVTVVAFEDIAQAIKPASIDVFVHISEDHNESTIIDAILSKTCFMGTVVTTDGIQLKTRKLQERQILYRMLDLKSITSPEQQGFITGVMTSLIRLAFDTTYQMDWHRQRAKVVRLDQAKKNDLLGESIVSSVPSVDVQVPLPDFVTSFNVEAKASYLVVGGSKGLGFVIAKWLVEHGAKLVWVSARSKPTQTAVAGIEYVKCDVTQKEEVKRMLHHISKRSEFPLQGIFHCAAAFADERLEKATEENWNTVMLPKTYGAVLLHQLTLEMKIELKHFVVISSIVALLGNTGQGSYCTANRFLISLCQYRRLHNLPATMIAPGAISEVGFAAREGHDERFDTIGLKSVTPKQVTEAISWCLMSDTAFLGLTGDFNKQKFVAVPQFRAHFFSIYKKIFPREELNSSDILPNGASPEEAQAFIMNILLEFITQRLGVTGSINPNSSLTAIGLDSAIAFELSSLIKSKFNVLVSSVELLNDALTVLDLVYLIYERTKRRDGVQSTDVRKKNSFTNTQWLQEPREVKNPRAEVICFPPTGMGITMFAEWSEHYAENGVRLKVVQLPGWEGRRNETPSSDMEYLVRELTNTLLSQLKAKRIAIIGCGIGALLAFEVIRSLQALSNVSIDHFYVVGWYAPSVSYTSIMGSDKKHQSNTDRDKLFLDNRDIRQSLSDRQAHLNTQASNKLCTAYRYVVSAPLRCNVTVFSGSKDSMLLPKFLQNWRDEVHSDYSYRIESMRTDHKLLRNEQGNKHISGEIMKSLVQRDGGFPLFKVNGQETSN